MTDTLMTSQLMTPLYASAAMRAIMSDGARLQRMLDFESALARAEGAVGVISATGAAVIGEACNAEHYDIAALVDASAPSGNIAIAVVNALTQAVAARDPKTASFVHWGATSQDVIDTALMLELRAAIDALVLDLDLAIKGFTTLAGRHRRTLAVARTLMQHALPMPFGLKLAGYAAALGRSRERLLRLRREALALQFGGAAGTLAALGDHGMGVAERLAALLDLQLPDAPWHTHRDRLAEVAACFGILAGTCGKIARDVALDDADRSRRGIRAGRARPRRLIDFAAQAQSGRSLGGAVGRDGCAQPRRDPACRPGPGARAGAGRLAHRLDDGPRAGARHLRRAQRRGRDRRGSRDRRRAPARQSRHDRRSDHGRGSVVRTRRKMGRAEAHALVQELSRQAAQEKRPLKDVLLSNLRVKWQLGGAAIEKLFMPLTYQGSAQTFIDRLVVSAQMRAPRRPELRAEIRPERRPEPRLPFPSEVRPDPAPEIQPQTRPIEPRLPTAAQLPSITDADIAAPTVEQRIEPTVEQRIKPRIEPRIEPSVVEPPPVLSAPRPRPKPLRPSPPNHRPNRPLRPPI